MTGQPVTGQIHYQLVGPLHLSAGPAEIARRQAFLQAHAAPGIDVSIAPIMEGYAAIESDRDIAVNGPAILNGLIAASAQGADAAVVGCFGDPVLDAARECLDIPVVGAGEAAMLLALQLGWRFSIISPMDGGRGRSEAQIRRMGISARHASTRGLGVDIAQMAAGQIDPLDALISAGRRAIEEDGADVLVLGCMSFAFLGLTPRLEQTLGVPVVNPVIAAVKTAEMLLAHQTRHGRIGWAGAKQKQHLQSNGE